MGTGELMPTLEKNGVKYSRTTASLHPSGQNPLRSPRNGEMEEYRVTHSSPQVDTESKHRSPAAPSPRDGGLHRWRRKEPRSLGDAVHDGFAPR